MARNLQEEGKAILGWVIAVMLGVAAIPALSLILPFLKFLPGWLTSSLVIGLPVGFAQWIEKSGGGQDQDKYYDNDACIHSCTKRPIIG